MVETATFHGIGVTRGVAVAPVFPITEPSGGTREPGPPVAERGALTAAIAAARHSLAELIEGLDEDAASILEFQAMLLEDDDLLAPVLAAVDAGAPADAAWTGGLDREIADYMAAEDEVFRARAADLRDLRDRVLRHLLDDDAVAEPDEPSILVARDLTPSRFLGLSPRLVAGIALGAGSRTSHVSLLARSRGVPLVVGLGDLPARAGAGLDRLAILDADAGSLVLAPDAATIRAATGRAEASAARADRARDLLARPAAMADGTPVSVLVNIDHPSIVDTVPVAHCDGVGLTRTEFLFRDGAPDEETQYRTYARIVRWAEGRPVTIRTLDAGGDKPVPGLTVDDETNPFLGVRGVRLSLARTDVFRIQLRALLRAAALGPVKIMVPMITEPAELDRVRGLLDTVASELEASGTAFARPPLGMMVEVPAAALAAETFRADFYSIGTNDLVQYATACARDNAAVAALARGDHPGVVRMIEAVVAAGRARGVEVSVCGDMASDPRDVDTLLAAGVRMLSTAPAELGAVKMAVAGFGGRTRGC